MSASSDYLSTLASLSSRSAAATAEGIRAAAQARAEAMRANGQLWGQTIGNIGQYISQIPMQIVQAKRVQNETAETALRTQQLQQQIGVQQRAIQGQTAANQIIASIPRGADGTYDTAALTQKLAGANVPPDVSEKLITSLDNINKITASFNQSKLNHTADLANAILTVHGKDEPVTMESVQAGMAAAKAAGLATDQDEQKLTQLLAQGADPEKVLKTIRGLGDKYKEEKPIVIPRGGTLATPQGQVLASGQAPALNEAEVAMQASGNDPAAAMNLLKPPPDKSITPYQQKQLDLDQQRLALAKQRETRMGAAQTAATAPPIEIKPGSPEYRIAADLASGKMTFSQFRTLAAYNRNAALKFGIYDTARQLNPEFDPAQYELGFKMASNPAIRQRIVAINALGPVIDQIDELASKTGNTDIPGFNKLLMGAKFQLGNKTITNFRQLQTLLGDEVGMALGVGTGSDLKTRLGLDLVNPNLGPAQFKTTMDQLRSVLEARRTELYKQMGVYSGGMQNGGAAPVTTPNAPAPAGRMRVIGPNGETGTVPDGTALPAGWKRQ